LCYLSVTTACRKYINQPSWTKSSNIKPGSNKGKKGRKPGSNKGKGQNPGYIKGRNPCRYKPNKRAPATPAVWGQLLKALTHVRL